MKNIALCTLALLLAACSFNPSVPPPPPPKVALVLGGGAVRGFAHIGVIKMLDVLGIKPDMVVGTSAGSIAGALYAAGYDGFRLQEMAWELDKATVTDWSLLGKGLIKGQALEDYINRAVGGRSIEQLKLPFACIATELRTGKPMVFVRGNVGQAVRASSSVPGVFEPVAFGGDEYVDGGLVSPLPIRFARQLGADFIIAVDVASTPLRESHNSQLDVLLKTYTIMGQAIRDAELPLADIVITPKLDRVDSTDFEAKNEAILAGEQAAVLAAPLIRQKLEERTQQLLATPAKPGLQKAKS